VEQIKYRPDVQEISNISPVVVEIFMLLMTTFDDALCNMINMIMQGIGIISDVSYNTYNVYNNRWEDEVKRHVQERTENQQLIELLEMQKKVLLQLVSKVYSIEMCTENTTVNMLLLTHSDAICIIEIRKCISIAVFLVDSCNAA